MAAYTKQTVSDGFLRGTEAGASVQIGTSAEINIHIQVDAKTVENVYKEASKYKSKFSASSWEKIERAHADGTASLFYGLLGISAGGSYDYYDQNHEQEVKNDVEAQHAAKALHDAEATKVTIQGAIQAVGQSYVPVEAYAFVHLTQISQNGKEKFIAVANQPDGKVADASGSQKDVNGKGKLNVLGANKFVAAEATAGFASVSSLRLTVGN